MKTTSGTSALFKLLTLCFTATVFASPIEERQLFAPTVTGTAPKATYIGSTSGGVDSFNAIPFAVPPVGTNRLYTPSAITTALGTVKATGVAASCPQQIGNLDTSALPANLTSYLMNIPIVQAASNAVQSEDCLTLNIQRPAGTTASSKLPVLFWIYGGGFEFGATNTYNAADLITTSVLAGQKFLYVAANYRLSAFGFLPGSEVKNAGVANLGLLDQRLALQWVADNIAKFGGDPTKVTIWGESAGSISVADQLALYDGNNIYKGKPLFRGAIMDSGSIVPANPVDGFKGQAVYASVVKAAGCSGAANTLQCLRQVPYSTFLSASNSLPGIFSYQSLALSYLPRPDGKYLTQSPELLYESGKFAKVPFIIGDQEDEGTLFSLVTNNITTTDQLVTYLSTIYFPDVPRSRVAGLVDVYPDDAAAGSPFNTGDLNNIYPEYKRIAALLGDITFTLTRRVFLNIVKNNTASLPTWSYLSTYFYGTPILGTFHGSDILIAYENPPSFAGASIASYYISFINYLNPNQGKSASLPTWPGWGQSLQLLDFGVASNSLTPDTFRSAQYNYISNVTNTLRI